MRRIPPTIASQHPDNASAPFWSKDEPFISIYEELQEAVSCFQDLGVSEYMWDWEGKHADAAVIDRLFTEHHDYFSKHQLGRDKFLTFRIPNIWEEKGYNLLQAMTVILSAEDFARDLKFDQRPLFEVILPMTERADQVLHMQKLFERLAKFKSKEFTTDQTANNPYLELIPLVEGAENQLHVGSLLAEYVKLHEQHFGSKPEYIRSFLACSDSALLSGFLAGVIANKVAVAQIYDFSSASGVLAFPFFGAGSLRFRGGLNPDTIDRFLQEFPGVRTVTVQSAFRYDYPKEVVKEAIARLESALPETTPLQITEADQKRLTSIASQSAKTYKQTLETVMPDMQPVFKAVPRRRDRRQHIGLLAYSRTFGDQTLPRAITFTGGFYSIGVPPEFIGSGRALKSLEPAELELLKRYYPNLAADFVAAGRFLNRDNLAELSKRNKAWESIEADVAAIEEVLKVTLAPQTEDELQHRLLSSKALTAKDDELTALISQTAVLRKSLG